MARPRKNNAEYFSHDANMRDDLKIKAVRRKFSHTGYAVWNYLLETLTDSDFFEIVWDDVIIDLLAADYGVTVELLDEIVNYLVKIGLLCLDGNKLYSPSHRKRLAPLMTERNRRRNTEQDSTGVLPVQNSGNTEDMPEFCQDSTGVLQGFPKVKESKVKESIVEESIVEDSKGGCRGEPANAEGNDTSVTTSADKPRRGTTKRTAFVVPAIEIVKDYFSTIKGTPTDAECFFDYFTANGWRTGKNPIKDWKAAARNWMRRKSEFNTTTQTNHETRKPNFL